jgi:serine/threonine-protein kinase
MTIPASGGEAKPLTTPDTTRREGDHWFPSVIPGGKAVLFTLNMVGRVADSQIGVLDLQTGERKIVISGGANAQYVDSGHVVYAAGGSLRAVRFDAAKLEVVGDPVPVVERVMTRVTGEANFDVSRTGTLVYLSGASELGAQRTLVWVNRQGREEPIKAPPRAYIYPRISPDGTRVALDVRDQDSDIWTWDLVRQTLTRLTFDPGQDRLGIWTPDGRRIIFSSESAGVPSLFWQSADGTGTPERLTTSPNSHFPNAIAPDGSRIVLREDAPKTNRDLMQLVLGDKPQVLPLVQTVFSEENAEISPDGRWMAYQSNESGQDQIYVRPFPNVNGGRWQVSTSGGTRPVWGRNGRELFYLGTANTLTVVPVQLSGTNFAAGNPATLFETRYSVPQAARTYDVSPDGTRFLMLKEPVSPDRASAAAATSLVVVVNWVEELKARLPSK